MYEKYLNDLYINIKLFMGGNKQMKEDLTFQDGIMLCKYIYQSAIDKTLNGVIEQEQIFYKAYNILSKIDKGFSNERLEQLLYLLNMENVYKQM